ncbi:predicted protein [Micromonas commoda]|uniref:KIF-binding protein n=1 Tax=Micromonas commoda (strain RCC299 / NOUM17 / CCMP2709) TaxID=296587 RepID=C1E2Q9_MICCC|nr:predicted protein [Micromonas commoda]ACO62386.1 predicted protein [Micromonas commoda]|eukprot:XP_002501128.1 predicted protein [Micromonas commoda]
MGGYVPPHMREGGRGREGAVGGDRAGGRGGRRGHQASSSRNRQPSVPATPDAAVEDAVRRKDAAERKLGKDGARGASAAASTLASIARELRSALAVPNLSPSARSDAGLALGEALCAAAAATVTAARHGPLTPTLARAERDARAAAARMYEDAATVLADLASWCERQIPTDSAGDDPDAWADATLAATTAAANALAALGDVGAASPRDDPGASVTTVTTLSRAVDLYESATRLASIAEAGARDVRSRNAAAADALAGLWNLADARVKLAEAIAASGHGFGHDQIQIQNQIQNQNVARAETLFAAAFAAYELACARCDSRAGDDLAGLLMDWGVGHASHARVLADVLASGGVGGAWDSDLSARALDACERATEKLARAAEFGVGDVDAHVAFGEAQRTRSEVLRAEATARKRRIETFPESLDPSSGMSTRSCDDLFADADAALARVSDPDHPHPLGFARALRLDSRHLDALVGAAECHVERGKMMRDSWNQPSENPSSSGDDSKAHFARGWATYRVALEGPLLFPDDRVDPGWASDRLEMAYNAACAACLAGDLDASERLLESVVECDDETREAIAADADLEALRLRRTFAGVPPGG